MTPISRRQNKRGRENEEPSFNDIMLMMTNQQMLDMRNREADREAERQERMMRQEEQREDRRMQQQMQQQLMTVMLFMMTGRTMPPAPAFPTMQDAAIPPTNISETPPTNVTETDGAINGSDGHNSVGSNE